MKTVKEKGCAIFLIVFGTILAYFLCFTFIKMRNSEGNPVIEKNVSNIQMCGDEDQQRYALNDANIESNFEEIQREKLEKTRENFEESPKNISVLSVEQMNSDEFEFLMEIFINLKTKTDKEIDETTADRLKISIEDFWDMKLFELSGFISVTIIKVEDFMDGTKISFELRIQNVEINFIKRNIEENQELFEKISACFLEIEAREV
jgi:hypothetical protein